LYEGGERKIILHIYYKAGLDLLHESGLVRTCRPVFTAVAVSSP